jgi:hypothetical protein
MCEALLGGCGTGSYCTNLVFSLDHAGLGVADPRRMGMRTLERVAGGL